MSELRNGSAAADCDLNFAPGEGCISPQKLLLFPVIEPPPFPKTNLSRPSAEGSPSFDFNSPLAPSDSPPTTIDSHSPSTSTDAQTPTHPSPPSDATCDHCHVFAGQVFALARHIQAIHRASTTKRLFCGLAGCKDVKDRRSLVRHLRGRAHVGDLYTCRCEKKLRKDNHRNHLRKCEHLGSSPYICMCGNRVDSTGPDALGVHQAHFEECGKLAKGRRWKDLEPGQQR
ncbi:hypothetical protein B0T25DRAFT_231400 [Lasiosphaeria hispida]|uniref:Uncharacterized protein n=1 Tax=Lasiosphaeria hispida TaxID=260671 RepID=A0AAJ0MC75_9PEZI|nr:hypothetical protein B0T25DRAFT_231400 [Lasiosphaeria hispida]